MARQLGQHRKRLWRMELGRLAERVELEHMALVLEQLAARDRCSLVV